MDPADEDLVAAIMAHVEDRARTPLKHGITPEPLHDEDGKPLFETHFFEYWLWGLGVGSWALPQPTIPRAVLEGFNDRHGCVLWRCQDCLTALGNASRYSVCPVCGSTEIRGKTLWKDRHWEFTPLTMDGRSVE
jgi:hypothetical protein